MFAISFVFLSNLYLLCFSFSLIVFVLSPYRKENIFHSDELGEGE